MNAKPTPVTRKLHAPIHLDRLVVHVKWGILATALPNVTI